MDNISKTQLRRTIRRYYDLEGEVKVDIDDLTKLYKLLGITHQAPSHIDRLTAEMRYVLKRFIDAQTAALKDVDGRIRSGDLLTMGCPQQPNAEVEWIPIELARTMKFVPRQNIMHGNGRMYFNVRLISYGDWAQGVKDGLPSS